MPSRDDIEKDQYEKLNALAAKTNVDTTAYMQANSVLKDKALNTNWKVRIEDSEMKFEAIVSQ